MATNPTLLTMPIAENGQKNTIPATQAAAGNGLLSQSTGFPPETALPLGAGGVAPSREDFNGLANLLGGVAFYAQKGWQFQFDAGQEYFAGCIVRDSTNDKLYECINDVAAGGSVPSADSTNWKEFSTGGGGVAVGFIMPYAGTGLQEGWLDCDGSAVSRTMYPDLFTAIGTTWGAGDGSTTFNLPRSEDLVLQGASTTNPVGTYKNAGLPNIKGFLSDNENESLLGPENSPLIENGAFGVTYGPTLASISNSGPAQYSTKSITFDASKSNSIYGNSNTVQPPAACVRFMIKAFDGQTPDSALIDVTQYAQELATKADRSLSNLTAAGEAKLNNVVYEDGFAIIYPNGGTEANPANVVPNSRYVEQNPFSGYHVACIPEVLVSGNWESPGQFINQHGINASQHQDGEIIIQTGSSHLTTAAAGQCGATTNMANVNSLQLRVKVWKIGKVASA